MTVLHNTWLLARIVITPTVIMLCFPLKNFYSHGVQIKSHMIIRILQFHAHFIWNLWNTLKWPQCKISISGKISKTISKCCLQEILPSLWNLEIITVCLMHFDRKSDHDSFMTLHCTGSFIITIPSSPCDLMMLKGTKTPNQGPFVQSVVSLTSMLRVISLTVLTDSIYNILIFFAEKMWVAFALQKLLTFFQQKISAYLRITWCKFQRIVN